jgi:predicted NodU family carbamoyl transferase
MRRKFEMKSDDAKVLREVQRNTKMAMKAIDTITDRVYDDDLSMHITRESMKYAELYNKATDRLLNGRAASYRENGIQDMMLKGGVRANTMLNTSTSHIAELLIQGSNRGLTSMWKAINHNENAGNVSMEIAKELMDFEEKNIEKLKQYL